MLVRIHTISEHPTSQLHTSLDMKTSCNRIRYVYRFPQIPQVVTKYQSPSTPRPFSAHEKRYNPFLSYCHMQGRPDVQPKEWVCCARPGAHRLADRCVKDALQSFRHIFRILMTEVCGRDTTQSVVFGSTDP